ncbi:cation-translocating P-type ATPase [Thomasclavelia cocleata]|uniref:Ca2+-transporting ATPase n=1 Tax=Thomasclavelia cocleata TaxID=69824 RepID=A0A1I0HED1_9FIRM|nr:cation-translocating P-type ATPase [Thomasclavelia cocleata]MCR1960514.1 cation-translocating P-type ATPase [Thomasclavelia cocleata]NDO41482.1 cation-translocating P-type ATPase [Thomasclavelia cocleata]PJN81699.1 cation-translocating P-type ATPase [Thomasclavelia cocleata]SET82053.1 Ca2+-transporting ATPase [Thomasclavelia cocleata]
MFYNQQLQELTQKFSTDLKNGLTDKQVKENLEKYGPNELKKTQKQSILLRFILQFKDALTIILIIAAIISIVVEPTEWIDSAIIIIVVIINAILGLVQESNAERSLEALQKMASPKAKVIRNGITITIDTSKVVPGDLLVLEAGDSIASDGRLIEAFNLKVDESALTGESVPVEKTSELIDREDVPLAERTNMVHASCNVTYGRGVALVTTTGEDNEVGKIATMLQQTKNQNTPLQDQLDQIGKSIGVICIVICIVVFFMEMLSGLTVLEAFKTAIALAVAAIPEGLATVVTVVLALSVQRMVKKNAIIKSLPAVETLGSTSIVCSDKTGTLTQNKMTVVKTYLYKLQIESIEMCSKETNELLNYFTLCSDGSISNVDGKEILIGDPTETALVKASLEKGFTKEKLSQEYPRFNELAFDSDRKMMTVFVKHEGKVLSITKGGPDVIFSRCKDLDLDEVTKVNEAMSNEALRVLALGIRYWQEEPGEITSELVENNLTFIGMVGMIDPPRQEAKQAIAEAKKAGVRTIMITGDHVITASAIARNLGILESNQKAVMGSELEKMSDVQLADHIEEYSVYARVAPEHKVRIVKAWKSKGKIVAMTGDGVNDSPALKTADIGCAMGITGTDVAKGAASMILTDDNFATIITSIKEGRGIFDNIKKDVQFLLSSNIGEVITIFGASVISLITSFDFGVPLLPIHLLWVNLITDSLPAFALGMEPTEPDVMERKPRKKDENFFSEGLGFTIAWQGVMIGVLTLIAYAIGNQMDHLTGMTMAFITLCGCQLVHAFNVKSHHSILNKRLFNNIYLWGALVIGILLQVILILIPQLSSIFKLQCLNVTQWLICIGLCLLTVVICEIVKLCHRGK